MKHKLEHYDFETEELNKKIDNQEKLLKSWDEKIDSQKIIYKTSVDECRLEEKLIEDMNANLERLRTAVNLESQSQTISASPQYEIALKAIESLSKADFTELKSFRSPPQRVLAVMNTLCLMFRQPPGWESGNK